MKYNYRLVLQYDGTNYNGWQRQGNTESTIQALLEEILGTYFQEKIELKGSGRTDKGVHAKAQTANFYTSKKADLEELKNWLNETLPSDIRVTGSDEVPTAFHSRKSAVSKTYEYTIWNSEKKNVFYRRYAYSVTQPLDLEKMEQAARLLCGTHDFIGFSSLKDSGKSTIRTIEKIQLEKQGERILIRFTGNGFLFHMVRILTGTLLEVGRGKKEPEEVKKIFYEKKRTLAGETVPANGLKLISVSYE